MLLYDIIIIITIITIIIIIIVIIIIIIVWNTTINLVLFILIRLLTHI